MDIDIDTPSKFNPATVFPNTVKASILNGVKNTPHQCGVYFQEMPVDIITNLAAIPYDVAEELGYTKIDFLHLRVYDHFTSRKEIEDMVKQPTPWQLLLVPSVVEKLFQLSKHGELLQRLKPSSTLELADALALIRPGKTNMLTMYIKNKDVTRKLLYAKEQNGYSFKKSHAIAYAMVVELQLKLAALNRL
jgi:DNA polymerase III alpha subunit